MVLWFRPAQDLGAFSRDEARRFFCRFLLGKMGSAPRAICGQSLLASPSDSPSCRALLPSMDTISRENNSMLPVAAIIVGVIALLLCGYAAISLSKINKTLTEQETKLT